MTVLDERLKEWATDRQKEYIDAVNTHGSMRQAAVALGVNQSSVARSVNQALAKAKLHCFDPKVIKKEPLTSGQIVLHIPDLHCPFMHQDAPLFIAAVKEKYQPTVIILAGDELDQHAISAHDADPNGHSAGHELTAGLKQLEQIYALFKEALVCESNHGQRPFKRAYKAGLPSQYMKTYAEFMEAPQGWVWAEDFEIDGVVYSHGESATGANGALNLAIRMGKSQAVGHWHGNAGASYFFNNSKLVFGLYSGCLIDDNTYAFRYGRHFKMRPILGCSIIQSGNPTFIPLNLDEHKRWTGKL